MMMDQSFIMPTKEETAIGILTNIERRHPTLEQATAMAENHQIADVQSLHEHLCSVIQWYYGADAFNFAMSTPSTTKKKLKSIQGTINKLLAQIDDLNENESHWFWKALHGYNGFFGGFFQRFTSAIGSYKDEKLVLPDGRVNLNKLDKDDVTEIIRRLNESVLHGIKHIPSDGQGRKMKSGLLILTYKQQEYWEDTLSRPFTFDEHNGEGITPAYFFCVDALRIIDPSVKPTEIKSQMRKIISETRKDERSKNSEVAATINCNSQNLT